MKTGFSPSEVGGIACCDRKMSSASSLSPYQAVCCTELSPLALGTGHTSCHPPPPPSPLFLSLFVCLSFSLSLFFTRVQWPTLPHNPPSLLCHPEALSFHSVSADWRPQCWQSSRPSEDTSNPVPPLCCSGAQCTTKGQGLQFQSQAITSLDNMATDREKALEGAVRITSYKHELDQLKPLKTRSMFSDCCDDSVVMDDCKYKA